MWRFDFLSSISSPEFHKVAENTVIDVSLIEEEVAISDEALALSAEIEGSDVSGLLAEAMDSWRQAAKTNSIRKYSF